MSKTVTCPECNGSGIFDVWGDVSDRYPVNEVVKCDTCDGYGHLIKCLECDGNGSFVANSYFPGVEHDPYPECNTCHGHGLTPPSYQGHKSIVPSVEMPDDLPDDLPF